MILKILICDICNEEIPKVKKKDVFGIEREYYRTGKLNYGDPFENIDPTRILGIHLCEKCAGNINVAMIQKRYDLIAQYSN